MTNAPPASQSPPDTRRPEASQNPPAGWYDDPHGLGTRWWNGQEWTEHVQRQSQAPPPPPPPSVPPPPHQIATGARRPFGSDRRVPIVFAAVVVVLIGAGAWFLIGRDNSSEQQLRADELAQLEAESAQMAIEVYAIDNGGYYEGATGSELRQIEPSLPENLEVSATSTSYVVTAHSEQGENEFSIARDEEEIERRCSEPGVGGCPSSGDWSDD